MTSSSDLLQPILHSLRERVKETRCLFDIEKLLQNPPADLETLMSALMDILPGGFQYPERCRVRITFANHCFQSPGPFEAFEERPGISADIRIRDISMGTLRVVYIDADNSEGIVDFLDTEKQVVEQIAGRVGYALFFLQYRELFHDWEALQQRITDPASGDGAVILDLLRHTDQKLFMKISRKMMNYLCRIGCPQANDIMRSLSDTGRLGQEGLHEETNWPRERIPLQRLMGFSDEIFTLAVNQLGDRAVMEIIQKWLVEDQAASMVQVIDDRQANLTDVIEAVTRYCALRPELSIPAQIRIRVALIRRFFFDRLEFINTARQHIDIEDFGELVKRIIYPSGSLGKLGGKGSGIILANRILQTNRDHEDLLKDVRVPRTWHIASDGMAAFLNHNNLEDLFEQKYKDIEQVEMEYPQLIQLFKNSFFPPEMIAGLSRALDDFGDVPLIVRSSSLLEDSLGTAFSGKYRSLFVANQGTGKERLLALMDAIAEVYASVFAPDPIQYRAERGSTDFREEMAILIQEVVGKRTGQYFFPYYAGVAFSRNEFRWSPRIRRTDGLIRLVPGLGTRAVDRVGDDYPVLLAPGQPGLRVNTTAEEISRYSPHYMDVINLTTNHFQTLPVQQVLREVGSEWTNLQHCISLQTDDTVRQPIGPVDVDTDNAVFTFDGLIRKTPFVRQIHCILSVLEERMGVPVDIEFASDGTHFFLLQCRPQSHSPAEQGSVIPTDITPDRILFTAHRYVSNGQIPEISHIIYVDPLGYSRLETLSELNAVGRAISRLNQLLPKHRFILMGPGRFGSRGDIKLGVRVTYADFSHTAMLLEIARKTGNYVPDLSFGTHFFQDLVESSIRYLPLYPDEGNNLFNQSFLSGSPNLLPGLLPEYDFLQNALHVIDVPAVTDGNICRILMNAEQDRAIGFLSMPE